MGSRVKAMPVALGPGSKPEHFVVISHNGLETLMNIPLIGCLRGHFPGSVIKPNAEFFNSGSGAGGV